MAMEKNAVQTKARSFSCPLCGKKITYTAGGPRCPVHGSAPFELRKKNE